jgi:hypothetical protein
LLINAYFSLSSKFSAFTAWSDEIGGSISHVAMFQPSERGIDCSWKKAN